MVANSLLHFDGDRYQMGDFVVMPNHVHLLAMFPSFQAMKLQCRSWKKFTAGEINEALGQRGQFWQDESFDHLVRSEMQFEYYQWYIAENPVKARLTTGQFIHYQRPRLLAREN
jgi:type I restriction enzyme R subunit